MTDVWRTRGPAYHSRGDCQGIFDGQAEARRQGKPNHMPELVSLAALNAPGDPKKPCQRCWPHEPGWYDWLQVELATEQHSGAPDGSEFELLFFHHVLRKVNHLKPEWVTVQARVEREFGAPLRPDFVIQVPNRRPIALEVDGHQKSANQDPDERKKSLRRDGDLQDLRYEVRHFFNDQVTDEVAWCKKRVTSALDSVEAEWRARQGPQPTVTQANPEPPASMTPVSAPPAAAGTPSTRWKPVAWIVAAVVIGVIGVIGWSVYPFNDDSGEDTGTPTSSGECSDSQPVKGNVSENGDRIFHEPGWEFYTRTAAEDCFTTAEDAEAAGYRASERQ